MLTLASRRQPAKQVVIDAVFLVPSLCFRSLSEGRGLVLSHGFVTVAVLGLEPIIGKEVDDVHRADYPRLGAAG